MAHLLGDLDLYMANLYPRMFDLILVYYRKVHEDLLILKSDHMLKYPPLL